MYLLCNNNNKLITAFLRYTSEFRGFPGIIFVGGDIKINCLLRFNKITITH